MKKIIETTCMQKVIYYLLNPSVCAFEWGKECKTDIYLNTCTCIKQVADNFVITYEDVIAVTIINSNSSKNVIIYYFC